MWLSWCGIEMTCTGDDGEMSMVVVKWSSDCGIKSASAVIQRSSFQYEPSLDHIEQLKYFPLST